MEWEKGLKGMNEVVSAVMISITESGESPSTGYDHPFNVRDILLLVFVFVFKPLFSLVLISIFVQIHHCSHRNRSDCMALQTLSIQIYPRNRSHFDIRWVIIDWIPAPRLTLGMQVLANNWHRYSKRVRLVGLSLDWSYLGLKGEIRRKEGWGKRDVDCGVNHI